MALESFYGGKPGLSSVIKKAFRYISEDDPAYQKLNDSGDASDENSKEYAKVNQEVMEFCLQDNSYEDVWYGELCIINTYNKSNPANGCLFRRTLIRQGSLFPHEIYHDGTMLTNNAQALSAEYIGQIVGPKGATPWLQIGDLEFVDAKADEEQDPYTETRWERKDGNKGKIVRNELLRPDEDTWRRNALAENIFISGRNYVRNLPTNQEEQILYNWFDIDYSNNIDKETKGEGWAYLGLQIPFFQADFNFGQVNYWEEQKQINAYPNRAFYQDWTIKIPRGVRGNAATEIGVTTLNKLGSQKCYNTFNVIKHNDDIYSLDNTNSTNTVTASFLREQIDDVNDENTKQIGDVPFYYCKYTIYNRIDGHGNGTSAYFYLGLERHIDSFELAHNGIVTAHYSDANKQELDEPIIWIDNITINPTTYEFSDNGDITDEPGVITITYNNDEATADWTKSFQLVLPKKITYADSTGIFSVLNTDGNSYELNADDPLIHPKTLSYTDNTGLLTVTPNVGEAYPANPDDPIVHPKEISYDDSKGMFYVTKNVGEGYWTNPARKIEYVKHVELAGDAAKDGSDAGTARRIQYYTNLDDTLQPLGDEINYVQEFVKHSDGHLYVLFNSPQYRYPFGETISEYPSSVTVDGVTWRNDIDSSYSNKLYWRDYGLAIGYHEGMLIGKVIPLEYDENNDNYIYTDDNAITVNSAEDIISNILNVKYSTGLGVITEDVDGTLDRRGMLAVAQMKNFFYEEINIYDSYYFAYDYDKKEWFLIQKLVGLKTKGGFSIKENGVELEIEDSYANITEYNYTGTALPAPWKIGGYYVFTSN